MAIEFDYTATDTPADVVLSVADAIRAIHRLAPLTDEQKQQRRIDYEVRAEEQAWRDAQRQIERDRQQAEAEAIARQEAATALVEANRKARLERQERIDREVRQRELADLRFQSVRHQAWQRDVENAARRAVAVRQQQALLADLERHFNPPPPPPEPEPEVVYVSEEDCGTPHLGYRDFNPKLWNKPRSCW